MKDFIKKCKQYKSWNEFVEWMSKEFDITTEPFIHSDFESLIGWFLRFLRERNTPCSQIYSYSDVTSKEITWEDEKLAFQRGILKAFEILEKE